MKKTYSIFSNVVNKIDKYFNLDLKSCLFLKCYQNFTEREKNELVIFKQQRKKIFQKSLNSVEKSFNLGIEIDENLN